MCNCTVTENYFEICSFHEIENCKHLELFLNKFPIINILLKRSNEINYVIKPVINEYNKEEIIYYTKIFLLYIDEIEFKHNKLIIALTLFEYLIKNFKIVSDHKKFHETVCLKLIEISRDNYIIPDNIIIKPFEVNLLIKHLVNIFLDQLWINNPKNEIFQNLSNNFIKNLMI